MAVRKWGVERQVNSLITGEQNQPSVATLMDGGYIIAWTDRSGDISQIRFRRYDAAGVPIGVEQKVQLPTPLNLSEPSVVALPNGGFAIGYGVLGSDYDLGFARYGPTGTFLGLGSVADGGGDQVDPALTQSEGAVSGFAAAYEFGGDIFLRRFDTAGSPVGDALRVDSDAALGEIDTNADVVQLRGFGGSYAVVWTLGNGVFGSIVRQDGQFTQTNVLLMNNSTGEAKVAALANGNFVVVIETVFGSTGIQAKLFDFNGGALTGQFDVTPPLLGVQRFADVVGLDDGSFAVIYLDLNTSSIRGQMFDAFGGRSGSEFIVSSSAAIFGPAGTEKISADALSDGRIIVTWTAIDSDGSPGLKSQIVDPREGIVIGSSAADTLYGHDRVNDELTGLFGDDVLIGLGGEDDLFGGEGGDQLSGGAGGDRLVGGLGNDSASYVGAAGVTASLDGSLTASGEAAGDIFSSIENIVGSSGADRLRGDAAFNQLSGGGGADILEGRDGNDVLKGGTGIDRLLGGAGSDALDGGTGADTLIGEGGNDSYVVDNSQDVVTELTGQGTDNIATSVSYTLSANVEKLLLLGTAANGTGNGLANEITGNTAINVINGVAGADTLKGVGGADKLNGGVGDDALFGGGGKDILRGDDVGGTQATDFFFFDTALSATSNVDTLKDFSSAFDTIALSKTIFTKIPSGFLARDAFRIVGTDTPDAEDRIIYDRATGFLSYDPDGTGTLKAVLFAILENKPAITNEDFSIYG